MSNGCRIDIYPANKNRIPSKLYAIVTDLDEHKQFEVYYVPAYIKDGIDRSPKPQVKSISERDIADLDNDTSEPNRITLYSKRSMKYLAGLYYTDFSNLSFSPMFHNEAQAISFVLDYFFTPDGTERKSYAAKFNFFDLVLTSNKVYERARRLADLCRDYENNTNPAINIRAADAEWEKQAQAIYAKDEKAAAPRVKI